MSVKCAYFNCSNKSTTMFPFPRDCRIELWIKNCGNQAFKNMPLKEVRKHHICIDHFNPKYVLKGKKKKLKKDAVPYHFSLWENSEKTDNLSVPSNPKYKISHFSVNNRPEKPKKIYFRKLKKYTVNDHGFKTFKFKKDGSLVECNDKTDLTSLGTRSQQKTTQPSILNLTIERVENNLQVSTENFEKTSQINEECNKIEENICSEEFKGTESDKTWGEYNVSNNINDCIFIDHRFIKFKYKKNGQLIEQNIDGSCTVNFINNSHTKATQQLLSQSNSLQEKSTENLKDLNNCNQEGGNRDITVVWVNDIPENQDHNAESEEVIRSDTDYYPDFDTIKTFKIFKHANEGLIVEQPRKSPENLNKQASNIYNIEKQSNNIQTGVNQNLEQQSDNLHTIEPNSEQQSNNLQTTTPSLEQQSNNLQTTTSSLEHQSNNLHTATLPKLEIESNNCSEENNAIIRIIKENSRLLEDKFKLIDSKMRIIEEKQKFLEDKQKLIEQKLSESQWQNIQSNPEANKQSDPESSFHSDSEPNQKPNRNSPEDAIFGGKAPLMPTLEPIQNTDFAVLTMIPPSKRKKVDHDDNDENSDPETLKITNKQIQFTELDYTGTEFNEMATLTKITTKKLNTSSGIIQDIQEMAILTKIDTNIASNESTKKQTISSTSNVDVTTNVTNVASSSANRRPLLDIDLLDDSPSTTVECHPHPAVSCHLNKVVSPSGREAAHSASTGARSPTENLVASNMTIIDQAVPNKGIVNQTVPIDLNVNLPKATTNVTNVASTMTIGRHPAIIQPKKLTKVTANVPNIASNSTTVGSAPIKSNSSDTNVASVTTIGKHPVRIRPNFKGTTAAANVTNIISNSTYGKHPVLMRPNFKVTKATENVPNIASISTTRKEVKIKYKVPSNKAIGKQAVPIKSKANASRPNILRQSRRLNTNVKNAPSNNTIGNQAVAVGSNTNVNNIASNTSIGEKNLSITPNADNPIMFLKMVDPNSACNFEMNQLTPLTLQPPLLVNIVDNKKAKAPKMYNLNFDRPLPKLLPAGSVNDIDDKSDSLNNDRPLPKLVPMGSSDITDNIDRLNCDNLPKVVSVSSMANVKGSESLSLDKSLPKIANKRKISNLNRSLPKSAENSESADLDWCLPKKTVTSKDRPLPKSVKKTRTKLQRTSQISNFGRTLPKLAPKLLPVYRVSDKVGESNMPKLITYRNFSKSSVKSSSVNVSVNNKKKMEESVIFLSDIASNSFKSQAQITQLPSKPIFML